MEMGGETREGEDEEGGQNGEDEREGRTGH